MSSKQLNRRQLLQAMGAGASVLALAACAPAVTPSAAPAEGDAAPTMEQIVVSLWSSYSGKNGEAETALVDKFNAENEDAQVAYEFQGNYEECAQKVTAALQAGTAPDMSLLSDVWWFKFYINQALVGLNDLIEAQNVDIADYQDSLINEGHRNGTYWWVPFARSTPLFYYNKEKWDAAGLPDRGPETWDEFVEWAPSLVEMDGDEMKTSPFVHPDGASYIAWLFQPIAWQFGGKYSDPDFTMHMTDENTIIAGDFYRDSVHTDKWAIPSKDVTSDFINGFTAATMMSTGDLGGLKANAHFEFGTAFLPKKDEFGCCTGGAGISILSSSPAENHAAAMKYIAFASNPENTTFWSQKSGYMPVRKSALGSAEMQAYFEEFPQFKTATEQLALTKPQDSARVWVPNGDQIIGKGLERITVQDEETAAVFAEVQATLETEAEPVLAALAKIEG